MKHGLFSILKTKTKNNCLFCYVSAVYDKLTMYFVQIQRIIKKADSGWFAMQRKYF